jgi:hypothetical protein
MNLQVILNFFMVLAWIVTGGYCIALRNRLDGLEQKFSLVDTAYKASLKLILTETERKKEHNKALKRLTDPEAIADDMEKGARLREMRDANRTILPREDAGPPAKVYSPKLRAKVPPSNYKK